MLPLTLGVLYVGALFPHIWLTPHSLYEGPTRQKARATLHMPTVTSVPFEAFISLDRMGMQLGVFVCTGFMSLLSSDL